MGSVLIDSSAVFFRSSSANSRERDTNFWIFLTDGDLKSPCRLPLARFAQGFLLAGLSALLTLLPRNKEITKVVFCREEN